MVLPLEMGWRHLLFENWTLYPAAAEVETDTIGSADGFDRPETDPVRFYSPGLDVVAEPSERAPPEAEV